MLVAADIAKGDTTDSSACHALQIAGATPSTENDDLISTGSDEIDRSFSDHQVVFIPPRADKNLIGRFSLFYCLAGESKTVLLMGIDD